MTTWTKKTVTLNSGRSLPLVGLGTYKAPPPGNTPLIHTALSLGYRHIDTALAYTNEPEIGAALSTTTHPRSSLFITTKLAPQHLTNPSLGLEISLKNLGVSYVDLYLMHWPISVTPDHSEITPDWDFVDAWVEMEKLLATGKVRSIGVSNFQVYHLERLLNDPRTTVVPAVNQIEFHPQCPSFKLLEYNRSKGIHTEAYSSMGAGKGLREDKTVLEVARSSGRTVSQVLLKWGLQRGVSVIPRSTKEERLKENLELDGWELSEEEMERLDGLGTWRRVYRPEDHFPTTFKFEEDE